jgi:hypothetical protein
MADPVTREDLRDTADSIRREFSADLARVEGTLGTMVGAVEKTVTTKIEAVDRGLWIKLAVAGTANVGVILGVVFAKAPGQAGHQALDFVLNAIQNI